MKKIGTQTFKLDNPVTIFETASIVGKKEADGPLAKYFDVCLQDEFFGEKTWEKAESKMIKFAIETVIRKSNIAVSDIDYLLAGDLLNQCISSSFGIRDFEIPFLGIFGACSTFVEGMMIGSMLLDGGAGNYALAATSSHFCSAEKQFRFPLELGNQRPPTSQWTVTGSSAAVLSKSGTGPFITHVTPGKIVDRGITDANNMGSAMAPAAVSTILTHLKDTGRKPTYYDAIITGDLGHIGKGIVLDLCKAEGFQLSSIYNDCGVLMFDKEKQDTHSGGSGCACCGTVFSGYFFNQLKEKKIKNMLLVATGALMNSTSTQQGESIPGIAHAVSIEL
jgi:stage V sporulation protein AD